MNRVTSDVNCERPLVQDHRKCYGPTALTLWEETLITDWHHDGTSPSRGNKSNNDASVLSFYLKFLSLGV